MSNVLKFPQPDYFSIFSGIARAHVEALIPNFAERERLALAQQACLDRADRLEKAAGLYSLQAEDERDTAKRISEQLEALR